MISNWKTIAMGFVTALVIYIAGVSIVQISILNGVMYLLAPLIGGFMVAYLNNSVYIDNIVSGGIASGIAGFTAAFIIAWLIEPVPVLGGSLNLLIFITIIHAVMAFVIGTVLGLVGGIIGVLSKGQNFEKENLA